MKSIKQRLTFALTALALSMFVAGLTPASITQVEAKTATQKKNENKAKAYKANQATKKAARASKRK